ncbi:MAG: hypothetical protein IPK94_08105 [Saprospiraceae bacterium]|nr:hypothetical protein [Saprospiraceae bacterium]
MNGRALIFIKDYNHEDPIIEHNLNTCYMVPSLMIIIMQYTGHPLKTQTPPGGILSFEFADTTTKVQSIYDAWQTTNTRGRTNISQARINTYWDFVFIFFYSALFFYWNWVSAPNR